MDDQSRVELIRRGNELFNQGDYRNALKIYLATDYKDGIIRVADYLYFDKKDKIAAVKLYKRAGHQKIIDEFAERAAEIVRILLEEDKKLVTATVPVEKLAEPAPKKDQPAAEKKPVQEWKPITLSLDQIITGKNNQK